MFIPKIVNPVDAAFRFPSKTGLLLLIDNLSAAGIIDLGGQLSAPQNNYTLNGQLENPESKI